MLKPKSAQESFYGSWLKRYLRKEEKTIFMQIVKAIQEGFEPQSIKDTLVF